MKLLYFLFFLISMWSYGQATVFINEIHYDDPGVDANEGVEIAGPAGTDLSTYTISLYTGSDGTVYHTELLSGTIPNEGSTGYGTLWFPIPNIQEDSPEGIALDNSGTLIQFLSYEGVFVARDGVADGMTSVDIGVSESDDDLIEGGSLKLVGTGTTYEDFNWVKILFDINNNPGGASPGIINPRQTFSATPASISITSPADNTQFPEGTLAVDIEFDVQNSRNSIVNIAVEINGASEILFTDQTSPFSFAASGIDCIKITTQLINAAILDTDTIRFCIDVTETPVSDIATLKMGTPGDHYELTGEALLTFQQNYRNQKYIEDATGAILIDDNLGFITSLSNIGDGVSGLTGRLLSDSDGTLRFTPIRDATRSSTGNTLTPQTVTFAELNANPEDYDAELVTVNAVELDNTTNATFVSNTVFSMTDGDSETFNFRTSFLEVDYIDTTIPTGGLIITGIINVQSGGTYVLTARDLNDIQASLSSNPFTSTDFSLFPNPTTTGNVTIAAQAGNIDVTVYNILGKQVKQERITNNTLNVSDLRSGIYILRLSQEGTTTTKKLVIR